MPPVPRAFARLFLIGCLAVGGCGTEKNDDVGIGTVSGSSGGEGESTTSGSVETTSSTTAPECGPCPQSECQNDADCGEELFCFQQTGIQNESCSHCQWNVKVCASCQDSSDPTKQCLSDEGCCEGFMCVRPDESTPGFCAPTDATSTTTGSDTGESDGTGRTSGTTTG